MDGEGRKPLTIADAFGGKETTLEQQRAIWPDAIHEDAIWEGPMFETPVVVIGRTAVSRFFEYLLRTVPKFSTQLIAAYPTAEPDTMIIESIGGGPTAAGGLYTQRYFSLVTNKDGKAFRMREFCNPFQTYLAFGKDKWDATLNQIMKEHNAPWPASQKPDVAASHLQKLT